MTGSSLAATIEARLPDVVLSQGESQEAASALTIAPEHMADVGEFLRDQSPARYDLLIALTEAAGCMHYQLVSTSRSHRLLLCVPVPTPERAVDSVAFVWPAADWAEREAHDLWRVGFRGHPNLRPLLLGADLGQVSEAGAVDRSSLEVGLRFPTSIEGTTIDLEMDGSQVVRAVPQLGHRHSGIEKRLTQWPYDRGTLLTSRIDGFAAMQGDLAYALATEELLGIRVPPRAQMLRVIYAELQRIASHLFWLIRSLQHLCEPALAAIDYAWEARTDILECFQWLGGNPITPDLIGIGGLDRDAPLGFASNMHVLLGDLGLLLDDLDQILTRSAGLRSRLEGVGVLDPGTAVGLGVTGPDLRASGVAYDLRIAFPYAGYDLLDVHIPVEKGCDALARYLTRMAEMRASLDLIRQGLAVLPEGPVRVPFPKDSPPPLPAGTIYAGIEGSRGEVGMLLVSDGSRHLQRAYIRAPSFFNLSALPFVTRGIRPDQVSIVLDSLDVSMAEVER